MKRTLFLVSFALSVLAALPGCGMKKEYIRVTDQLDSIELREKRIERRTAALDSLSQVQMGLLYELRAELKSLSASAGEKWSIAEQQQEDNKYRPLSVGPSQPDPKAPAPEPKTEAPTETNPKKLYDASYLDITKGNYDLALSGFNEFIKRFPKHDLADNAQYWIGEGFYAQKKYDSALAEFEKVVGNYPGKDKEPAALYKIGLCLQEMGDKDKARQYWQLLAKKYPKSPEAALAKDRLK
ncbi:tol-pal system protein YbgF [candidate division TA06 bacterium]|uniref:Tol-pal system protein YbgF n=1 Tax=candidate division TA06 bacterium TaxID=2250710 RepID=A0A933MK42_UNCT6|nr:tol-pal system protein YbgF [candidate division TA06 bacterium]